MNAPLCRIALLVVLLAGCAQAPAPMLAASARSEAAASTRSESKSYTTTPLGGVNCASNAGGACFELTGAERSTGILVNDDAGWVGIPLRYVFMAADGSALAEGTLCDRGWAAVPQGAVRLAVEVTGAAVQSGCNALSLTQAGEITVTHALSPDNGNPPALDGERECIAGFVQEPLSMNLQGLDTGQRLTLKPLILVDQGAPGAVDAAQAQTSMDRVIAAYDVIGITVVPEFRTVTLATPADAEGFYDKDQIFDEVRALLGGGVPAGFDLGHIMTTKDISGAAGYADCVGGIRSRRNAFSIAEEIPGKPPNLIRGVPAPVWPWTEEGYISTHEIGHLLGGNHDYANCVEGVADMSGAARGPCTVMHANLNITFAFSTLNRITIREYAIRFAAP